MEFTKKVIYVCPQCGTENNSERTECKECGWGSSQCPSCGKYKKVSEPSGDCEYCKAMGSDEYSLEGMPFPK